MPSSGEILATIPVGMVPKWVAAGPDGTRAYVTMSNPPEAGHAEGAVLSDNISAQTVMTVASTGRKEMPSFRQSLSEKDLRDVAAYVSRLLKR